MNWIHGDWTFFLGWMGGATTQMLLQRWDARRAARKGPKS